MSTSKGACSFCNAILGKRAMVNHLLTCKKRKKILDNGFAKNLPKQRIFHLVVEGTYHKNYWMHLEMPANVTLKKLDNFLRAIWLECCGHLSAFTIGKTKYYCDSKTRSELGGNDMKISIAQVVAPNKQFFYEYDFGSTTYLSLTVLSERDGQIHKTPIEVLARNNPPAFLCEFCQKPATQICGICGAEGKGIVCDNCVKKHPCEEGMFLPVVNSPRMGVCGYCGGSKTKPIVQKGWMPSGKVKE